ncbi:hypothetical protein [Chitinophaga rhizophila]|uniref:RHS repeat-associated core domain-containing protein n=1 Tax=Chitinophaga rhizophila TaxID=2866212 RepID=A0ABS7GH07_9BACT|nr:hypothetical protein [Chitinophaga rhizophila]MBW8686980.1 hypothetical protein [Chitinophaga rhizophila]
MIRSVDLDGAEKRVRTYSYTLSGGKPVLKVTDNVSQSHADILIGEEKTFKQIAAHSAITYQSAPKPDNGSFSYFEFAPELGMKNYAKYTYTDNSGKQQVEYFTGEHMQFRIEEVKRAQEELIRSLNIAAASANLVGTGMMMKAELKAAAKVELTGGYWNLNPMGGKLNCANCAFAAHLSLKQMFSTATNVLPNPAKGVNVQTFLKHGDLLMMLHCIIHQMK